MKRFLITLSCMIAFVAVSRNVSAAIVDTVGVDTATGGPASTYTGVGVLDTSSRAWEATLSGGTFMLGGETITVTYGGPFVGGGRNGGAAILLFDDIRHNNGSASFDVTLSGLDNDLLYNLAVYGADFNSGARGSTFEILGSGLGTKTTTGDSSDPFSEGVNYVRFDSASASGGTITIQVTLAEIASINGFEIQAIQPLPEPSTLFLAALGLVGLVLRRRRCSRA